MCHVFQWNIKTSFWCWKLTHRSNITDCLLVTSDAVTGHTDGSHWQAHPHIMPHIQKLCCTSWPGSAGCYPLTAVTMRVAVLGELVVSVLAWGLVSRQGLRAGSVDSASHENTSWKSASYSERPQGPASSERPVLSWCRPAALWESHWLSTLLS